MPVDISTTINWTMIEIGYATKISIDVNTRKQRGTSANE